MPQTYIKTLFGLLIMTDNNEYAETLLIALVNELDNKHLKFIQNERTLEMLKSARIFAYNINNKALSTDKNTPEMSKILDKKACKPCEKSTAKPELSIDQVYQHLLQDRAEIASFTNKEQRIMLLIENTESITNLLLYKDDPENDIDY